MLAGEQGFAVGTKPPRRQKREERGRKHWQARGTGDLPIGMSRHAEFSVSFTFRLLLSTLSSEAGPLCNLPAQRGPELVHEHRACL